MLEDRYKITYFRNINCNIKLNLWFKIYIKYHKKYNYYRILILILLIQNINMYIRTTLKDFIIQYFIISSN